VESAPLPPIDEGPPLERFEPTSEDKNLAMFCHLGGWLTGFLVPLIIWLIQKDKSRFVDDQGKEALNFQLTLLIAYAISVPLMFVCVGIFLFFGAWIFALVVCIMGTVAASKGERYRYPLCIRFIK
jgi:uncharacterized Tic20 family protein